MRERFPSGETSESQVVEMIRSQPESPETWDRFRAWCRQELAKHPTARGQTELNLKIASIYRSAGQPDQAWDELEGVRQQAIQEGFEDLYDAAMALMDDMERTGR